LSATASSAAAAAAEAELPGARVVASLPGVCQIWFIHGPYRLPAVINWSVFCGHATYWGGVTPGCRIGYMEHIRLSHRLAVFWLRENNVVKSANPTLMVVDHAAADAWYADATWHRRCVVRAAARRRSGRHPPPRFEMARHLLRHATLIPQPCSTHRRHRVHHAL
jgi:hypothetical protein